MQIVTLEFYGWKQVWWKLLDCIKRNDIFLYYKDIGVVFSWCGDNRQEWDCEGCDCSGYIDEDSNLIIVNHCGDINILIVFLGMKNLKVNMYEVNDVR